MPNVPEFAAKGQDALLKAVDTVVDQVTATATELLSLSQEVQDKVIAALKSNA